MSELDNLNSDLKNDLTTTPESSSVAAAGAILSSATSGIEAQMELAKLYYERCDFEVAIQKYRGAADEAFRVREYEKYLKCQNHLLRMYAEREDVAAINATKEALQDLVLKEGFELNAKTYYTLGICASYKGQFDVALDYFQKSLAIALASDSKADICYAINGLAVTYYSLDRTAEALKEIYNLQVFFQVLPLREIKISSQMINGNILRKMKKFDQALEIFWDCYDLLREEKNLYLYLQLLYSTAATYRDSGELDMARMYFKLAKKSADPANLKYLSRHIDQQLADLGVTSKEDYDLIFDAGSHSVLERKKGRVDFKNQFILLDMLRLFMRHPGEVYSKEQLVKQVWKQDYDPAIHDNKIYVTIKRLRKLIEPDYEKPRYIFRAKNGYYLNKNTKVLLEQ
ncbi:MAG TPA: tetratricopeptide repeat protein [Pseudobdellovibrionaceae bacterium]|nr:tetratricopeptide repeat protein [Pseudobdellovibrionaceae bacterium]